MNLGGARPRRSPSSPEPQRRRSYAGPDTRSHGAAAATPGLTRGATAHRPPDPLSLTRGAAAAGAMVAPRGQLRPGTTDTVNGGAGAADPSWLLTHSSRSPSRAMVVGVWSNVEVCDCATTVAAVKSGDRAALFVANSQPPWPSGK